jgi:hypothetical protein
MLSRHSAIDNAARLRKRRNRNNVMNIPGFTAEAVLNAHHHQGLVVPAAAPEGGSKKARCVYECLNDCDDIPATCRSRCAQKCKDSGSGGPPSCDDGVAECVGEFIACSAIPFGLLGICQDWLHVCLENNTRNCLIARHGPLSGGTSYPRSGVFGRA